jgi:hypothetical protein
MQTSTVVEMKPALGGEVMVTPFDDRFESPLAGKLSQLSPKTLTLTLCRPLSIGCLLKVQQMDQMWVGEVVCDDTFVDLPGEHHLLVKLEPSLAMAAAA